MSSSVLIGIGVAVSALGVRMLYKNYQSMKRLAAMTGASPFTHYYKGSFEPVMSRREASLVLGVREFDSKEKIKEAHRRIMMLNHPDRGGSPYLAMKINEAKAVLENKR